MSRWLVGDVTMSSGILEIPYAYHKAGVVLAVLLTIVCLFFITVATTWILEASARAGNALLGFRMALTLISSV